MSVIITHISNIQFKKFQYINIHNGFLLDETKFKQSLLNENNETKQIVWDVHCGPISPLSHNQKKLLKIENISKKNSFKQGGSHQCLNNKLYLPTTSTPKTSNQCPDIHHHPYKLNELVIKNVPYNYNESQVLQIFNKYKSIKLICFINQAKNKADRPCKTAVIQTSS
eukprot:455929_1